MSNFMDKYAAYTTSHQDQQAAIQAQKEKLEQMGGGSFSGGSKLFGIPQFKFAEPGSYSLRFLPGKPGPKGIAPYYRSLSVYYIPVKNPGGEHGPFTIMVVCPENYGRRSLMGEERKRLMFNVKDGTPDQKKSIRRALMQQEDNKWLQCSTKHFAVVIPPESVNDPSVDDMHILMYGRKIEKALESAWHSKLNGGDFTHPALGFPIHIKKTQNGSGYMGIDYEAEYSKSQASLISQSNTDDILASSPDLGEFVSYEYQWGPNGSMFTTTQIVMMMHGLGMPEDFRKENAATFEEHRVVTDPFGDRYIADLNKRISSGDTSPLLYTLPDGNKVPLRPDWLGGDTSATAAPPVISSSPGKASSISLPPVPTPQSPDDADIPF